VRLILRPAEAADLPALIRIERECFPNAPWSGEDLAADECSVAVLDGCIVGFLISRQTFPQAQGELAEREILNLAVLPEFRHQGIGTALVRHELQRRAIYFLEVRESNLTALALYRKLGFQEIARRPEYYESPVETAIVMRMK
jgi:ribosomal-protein-alanine acetyltransferase